MKVEILYGNIVIGRSDLDCVDPSMGVAAGYFEPTADYVPELHANIIDGVYRERGDVQLIVRNAEFGDIDSEGGVGIEDFSRMLGEREVTVFGIRYPDYEAYFAHYPTYQAFKP